MQHHVEDISPVQKKITIEVPAAQVNKEIDKACAAVRKTAKLKGYRTGRVPMELIKKTYRDTVRHDVMCHFFKHTLFKTLAENNIHPLDTPIVDSGLLESGAPFKFSAIIEVMPQIILNEYIGLQVNSERYVFNPQSIEDELLNLQRRMTRMIPLDEGTTVDNGHFVSVDIAKPVDDAKEGNSDSHAIEFEIGSSSPMPGIAQQLIGMKAGESKEISLDIPSDGDVSDGAGKRMLCSITVKAIKRREIPELNDEFAQQYGESKSMDELRAKLVAQYEKFQKERIKNELKDRIVRALIEKNPLDVPESMIKRQLDDVLEGHKKDLESKEMTEELEEIDEVGFHKRFRDNAIENVKGCLLLMALMEKENISVTDEDLHSHYEIIAAGNPETLASVREYYSSDEGAKNFLIAEVREDKAISYLIDHAVVTEVDVEQSTA